MQRSVELTPEEFEKQVESLLRENGQELRDFKIVRRDVLSVQDGTYEIDVTTRFKALGTEFLVLVECKHYSSLYIAGRHPPSCSSCLRGEFRVAPLSARYFMTSESPPR